MYLLGLRLEQVAIKYEALPSSHLARCPHPMSLLANIVGFSLVGLAARIGQLGIQKQNLFMSVFLFRIQPVDILAKILQLHLIL